MVNNWSLRHFLHSWLYYRINKMIYLRRHISIFGIIIPTNETVRLSMTIQTYLIWQMYGGMLRRLINRLSVRTSVWRQIHIWLANTHVASNWWTGGLVDCWTFLLDEILIVSKQIFNFNIMIELIDKVFSTNNYVANAISSCIFDKLFNLIHFKYFI